MAISKARKNENLEQYAEWANRSRALIVTEYRGLNMKKIDDLRAKVRQAGGEFHIVKNTLGKLAFQKEGMSFPEGLFEGSTAIGFAFNDAPAVAKTMTEFARTSDFLKIKGGFLDKRPVSAADIQSLAEPARGLAAVFKALADKDNTPAAA